MMSTDGTQAVTVTVKVGDESVSAGVSSSGKCQMTTLTPRFTQEEKEILYALFHQHEEVIDIKFRKRQRSKMSVRGAWEQIMREFNSMPGVSATRNLKQIQKFWLNSRLRKQYPFRHIQQKQISNDDNDDQLMKHEDEQHAIKVEPDFHMNNSENSDQNEQSESFEEMEMEANGVNEIDDDPLDAQQQQEQQQLQHQVAQQTATIHTQQISVDQISAEKLTLNDLLQFKTTRPREEIILQIKHPSDTTGTQITIPSPTRITIPTHHHQPQQHTMATITAANGFNQQIISEIKPQQITLAQYQAQQQLQQHQQQQLAQQQQQQLAQQAQLAVLQQQQQHQQQQQQQAAAAAAAAAAVVQQHQHVKMQLQTPTVSAQYATATPTFTCTTYSALPTAVAAAAANNQHNNNNNTVTTNNTNIATLATSNPTLAANLLNTTPSAPSTQSQDSYEEKVNYFKMKEAELRYKEQQLSLEKKKIELSHVQDQLKHLREVHRLQVEELKMKIRILHEEEKQLRKSISTLDS